MERAEPVIIQSNATHTILGAGGGNPRVALLADPETFLPLPAGHSVYALHRRADGKQFVAGTKCGGLFLFEMGSSGVLRPVCQLNQGAPVLDVVWGASTIMSSDTRGRCLRWHPPFTSSPECVYFGGAPFCALVMVGAEIWGQTQDGRIFVLADDASAPEIVHEGALPPRPYGWVHGLYWRAADALVFAATSGCFIVVNRSSREVRTLNVHSGDAFACCSYGDLLVTVGREDNYARMWRPGLSLDLEAKAPPGLVRLALTSDPSAPFAGIDENGHVLRMALAGARLESKGVVLAGPFRAVCGVTPEELEVACDRERSGRAAQVAERAAVALETGDMIDLSGAAKELRRLGRPEAALALEAEAAAATGDIRTQLNRRLELARHVEGTSKCLPSILKLVHLLAVVLRFDKAHDFLRRISFSCDAAELGAFLAHMEELAQVAQERECLASPGNGIDPLTVLQSFDVLGAPPWRWLLARRFPELPCCGLTVRPADLTEALRMLWDTWPTMDRPQIALAELWLLSPKEAAGPETLAFIQRVSPDADGVELALGFRQGSGGTAVIPMLTCDVHRMGAGTDVTWPSQTAGLKRAVTGEYLPTWIRAALSDVRKAVGNALSEQLAGIRRGGRP